MEWPIRNRKPTATEIIYHSGTFYTTNPGYRVQFRAQIDRLHGDVYFSVRILQGWFDDHLPWPFALKFCMSVSRKTKNCFAPEEWIIPSAPCWKREMDKPANKKEDVFSEWCGPFNISAFVGIKTLVFEFSLAES